MHQNSNFSKLINNKIKPAILRIVVSKAAFNEDGSIDKKKTKFSFCSGFITNNNVVVSCAHSLSLMGSFKKDIDLFKKIYKQEPKISDLKVFITQHIKKIEYQRLEESTFSEIKLKNFDVDYDVAIFEFSKDKKEIGLELDKNKDLNEGDEVAFAGFPTIVPQYGPNKTPFTVNEGIISSFPDLEVGGLKKYSFIQVSAVNLGGNSGAPLFIKESGKVVGVVTGSQNISFDIFEINNNKIIKKIEKRKAVVTAFGIAYATPIKHILNLF